MGKFAILVILTLIIVGAMLPGMTLADEPKIDPFLVNQSLYWIDAQAPGTYTVELVIHNVSGEEKVFGVSSWWNYTYPDEGKNEWIDPSWISRIIPESMLLPINGKMIVMVEFNLPPEAMNKVFKTWVKVYDEPVTSEKPIVIVIRTGTAIPTYQYSVSPSSYRVKVYGTNASAVIDDGGDKVAPPISIRNECSGIAKYCAIAEAPGRDIVISADSAIAHTPDEVGKVFKGITTEEAQKWFSTPYGANTPLSIDGFRSAHLAWNLAIPDEVKNGNYAIGIRVRPAESLPDSAVGIEYLIWLLIEVDRDSSSMGLFWIWPLAGGLGLFALFGIIAVINHRRENGKKRLPRGVKVA